MPMGTVEIKGKAKQGPENVILKSPFSGKDCLLYKYQIEEYRQRGDDSDWVTVASGFESVRFLVDDGTGQVIIDPEDAEIEIPKDNLVRVNSSDETSDQIRNFMEKKSISETGGLVFDNDRRYSEWFITPEEDIYVFGYASNEKDDRGEYNVIKDDERADMFMISDRSEKELTNKKKWRSRLMMFGGALGTLGLYALMLSYTGAL
jgi:hypothetical protein